MKETLLILYFAMGLIPGIFMFIWHRSVEEEGEDTLFAISAYGFLFWPLIVPIIFIIGAYKLYNPECDLSCSLD